MKNLSSEKKFCVAVLLGEVIYFIIQFWLVSLLDWSGNPKATGHFALRFDEWIIVYFTISLITAALFFIFFKLIYDFYSKKLDESLNQYLTDTTELAQLHELHKAEDLEKIKRLNESNISLRADLRKKTAECKNLSSAYIALLAKYEELEKQNELLLTQHSSVSSSKSD